MAQTYVNFRRDWGATRRWGVRALVGGCASWFAWLVISQSAWRPAYSPDASVWSDFRVSDHQRGLHRSLDRGRGISGRRFAALSGVPTPVAPSASRQWGCCRSPSSRSISCWTCPRTTPFTYSGLSSLTPCLPSLLWPPVFCTYYRQSCWDDVDLAGGVFWSRMPVDAFPRVDYEHLPVSLYRFSPSCAPSCVATRNCV